MKPLFKIIPGIAAALTLLLSGALASAQEFPQVRIETTLGSFVVELDRNRSPLTVDNFLKYVESGFYEGTLFHRVVENFVIQGGGFTVDLKPKEAGAPIPNESGNGYTNRRGTIAMARTNEPHSADSQFFINLADNPRLDPIPSRWGYAVFGDVIEGMEVVDEIGTSPTTTKGDLPNTPSVPVIIERVVLITDQTDE